MKACLLLPTCTKQKLKCVGSLGSELLSASAWGFLSSLEETCQSTPGAFPYLRCLLLAPLRACTAETQTLRVSHLSPLLPLFSPIYLEKQQEKKRFKPEQGWRWVKWRSWSGLMLSPKLLAPRSKPICNESLHRKTKYSDYYHLWLFSACLHSTKRWEQRLVFALHQTARKRLMWVYSPHTGIFIPRCVNLAHPARHVCQRCCKTRPVLWAHRLWSHRLEIFMVEPQPIPELLLIIWPPHNNDNNNTIKMKTN